MCLIGCRMNLAKGTPLKGVAAHMTDSLLCNTWSPKKKMTVVGHAASRPAAVVPAPPANTGQSPELEHLTNTLSKKSRRPPNVT